MSWLGKLFDRSGARIPRRPGEPEERSPGRGGAPGRGEPAWSGYPRHDPREYEVREISPEEMARQLEGTREKS